MSKRQTFEKGEVIVRENEVSRRMFVLKKGKVRVYKTLVNHTITLAVLGEGEIFGEMSFFDGQPRSASVQALTQIEVFIIDSEEVGEQLKKLPDWLVPILRTVFTRLRLADARAATLESRSGIEKRHLKRDPFAQSLYNDLIRVNKILLHICRAAGAEGRELRVGALHDEIEELVGSTIVDIEVFCRVLKDNEFVDRKLEASKGVIIVYRDKIETWISGLAREAKYGRFLLLSSQAMIILKKFIAAAGDGAGESDERIEVSLDDTTIAETLFHEDGLAELLQAELIEKAGEKSFYIVPRNLVEAYEGQRLLKYFDSANPAMN